MSFCTCIGDIILVIVSVLFPPLPVWIRRGLCSCDSFINIALCFLGYLPGLIHSWYIIAKYPPYSRHYKVYHIHAGDLENQVNVEHHHHHCHHHNNKSVSPNVYGVISQQPLVSATPSLNYGTVEEGQSSRAPGNQGSPPAYSELPKR